MQMRIMAEELWFGAKFFEAQFNAHLLKIGFSDNFFQHQTFMEKKEFSKRLKGEAVLIEKFFMGN